MTTPDASGHQEIELKRLLLGEDAAEKLIRALAVPVETQKRQVNHVFDTDGLRLSERRYSVRLRIENGDAFLTAKGPSRAVGTSTGAKVEAEAPLETDLVPEVVAGRADPVALLRERVLDPAYAELWRGLDAACAGRPLGRVGQFENLRRTVPVVLPSGLALHVEIDRTLFPDAHVDHEVEIELPSDDAAEEAQAWLDAVARSAGVETADSSPKTVRFLSSLSGASA